MIILFQDFNKCLSFVKKYKLKGNKALLIPERKKLGQRLRFKEGEIRTEEIWCEGKIGIWWVVIMIVVKIAIKLTVDKINHNINWSGFTILIS